MRTSLFLVAASAILLCSCTNSANAGTPITASGADVTRTVTANTIKEISTCRGIQVNYTVGSPVSVTYQAPESVVPYLDITCVGGKLKCTYKVGSNVVLNNRYVVVTVVAPNVNEFEAASAGSINVTGTLNVASLDVEAESSGQVTFATVQAKKVDIESSSSGNVSIAQLTTRIAEIEASSSGSVSVNGTVTRMDAEASSAGKITIAGTCTSIEAEASSAGAISATDAKIDGGSLKASSGGTIQISKALKTNYTTSERTGGTVSIR